MRRLLLAAFFLALSFAAHGQNLQRALVVSSCGGQALAAGPSTNLTMNPAGQLCIGGSVGPTYTGPGDAVSGASAWFGLRAYNAAYATATGKAINLRRSSDNATCDFNVSATGDFGVSATGCAQGVGLTASAFATQDATANCTIATATATCTGGSSLPHINSVITGVGVGNPCYATAAGVGTAASFTVAIAGGNGVGTAPCGTVGSAAAVTFTYGLNTPTFYDQIGTACSGACNYSQATAASQPKFFAICTPNNLPCLYFNALSGWVMAAPAAFLASTPNSTVPAVLERNGRFTSYGFVAGNSGGTIGVGFANVANTAAMTSGGIGTAVMADSVFHSTQYLVDAGSAGVNVDNTFTASVRTGANWNASALTLGNNGANTYQGYTSEVGIWPSLLNTTQLTTMCHNQFAYWGTTTSC